MSICNVFFLINLIQAPSGNTNLSSMHRCGQRTTINTFLNNAPPKLVFSLASNNHVFPMRRVLTVHVYSVNIDRTDVQQEQV